VKLNHHAALTARVGRITTCQVKKFTLRGDPMMRKPLLVIAVLSHLFLLTADQSATAQKTAKMTVGFSATGGQYINIFVAKELGLFEKRALDVTLNQLNSSAQTVASLRSASVDVATGPVAPVIDAIPKGMTDFTIFGEAMPHTVLEVWVQPNIKSVKDLVGKTISSTNPNSLGDVMIGVWLNKNGLKKTDVNVVYLGGLSNLVSAMRAGKTEATLILPPLGEQLIPSGQKRLTDLRDLAYSNQAWVATKNYAKSNGDVLQRFTAAVIEAIAITKRDKQKVLPVLPKYTGVTNADWNDYAYEFFAPLLERVPRVTVEVMKATQELSPNEASRNFDLKPYIDNSYVDKLAAEGFIDSLYKK
jgi:NitT/TauT family transport system substrate-binding protein